MNQMDLHKINQSISSGYPIKSAPIHCQLCWHCFNYVPNEQTGVTSIWHFQSAIVGADIQSILLERKSQLFEIL